MSGATRRKFLVQGGAGAIGLGFIGSAVFDAALSAQIIRLPPGTPGAAGRGKKLRALLGRKSKIFAVMGVADGGTARMMDAAGVEAAFIGTSNVQGRYTNLADRGLTTTTESLVIAKYLAESCAFPLILDGDTGHGGPYMVRRLVQECIRLGLAVVVMLMTLIGGRIVPSFTRNWLSRENPGRLPVAFNHFDATVIAASVATLALWIIIPQSPATGAALTIAGTLQSMRLARWAGDRSTREHLVLILHLGYAFIPLGFLLLGAASLELVAMAAGVHAWGGGAAGTMTLAVMTRASLGHTGHVLTASRGTQAIYAAVLLAAMIRITAALAPAYVIPLSVTAAILWASAFLGFGVAYGPMLSKGIIQHDRKGTGILVLPNPEERD